MDGKTQFVFFGCKGCDERFFRADHLSDSRADPENVLIAGIQKRLNPVFVIIQQYLCGVVGKLLNLHKASSFRTVI